MTVDTWLGTALNSADPVVAMTAATSAAYVEQHPPAEATRRIFDQYYHEVGNVNDHIEVKLTDPRQAIPTGSLVLKGSDALAEHCITCETTVVPFVYDKGAYRWSGRVDVAHDRLKDGLYTVECELVHDKVWLDRILCWPNPFLPILIQEPTHWFGFGPAITVMKTLIAEQCFRLQLGLWELVNNLGSLNLDYRAWFGTLLLDGIGVNDLIQAVTTPIYVVPTDPFFDTSPWIELDGRMETVWKLIQQQVDDNGLSVEVHVWLPGEPQPKGVIFPLQVATIVVDIKDRSGITGATGTFLDGLEIDLVSLQGSLLGETLAPFLNPNNAYAPPGVDIAPAIGVNFTIPWVLYNCDIAKGGVIEFDVAHHHPLAWQILIGGKSPQWLDDLINATLEYLVDALMIVAGFTGIPSDILNGIFDDVILAFSLVENFERRQKLGPYGLPEKFFPSNAGALSVDAFFAEKQAMWDTRGWPAAQISTLDGYPYELGRDIFPGSLAAVIRRGKLYVDYVENIEIIDNRSMRNRLTLQIGDGKSEESSQVKVQRKIVGIENLVNILTMSAN